MFTLEDWRDVPAEQIARLYDAECGRWDAALGWDYRPSCGLIESARISGRLRGLLARAASGDVLGWTYFLLHRETLQIGNLVGRDDHVAAALLGAILEDRDARRARRLSCFLFPATSGVELTLAAHGFVILRHAYLRRPLGGAPAPGHSAAPPHGTYTARDWSAAAVPGVVGLLRAAYEGSREARCFAPDGDLEQWTSYLHHLVHTPACGRFDRRLSLVVEAGDKRPVGAILVTALGRGTAHVAQMAVAREHRRRGLGEWLVASACERAGAACFEQMTLLVAESNERARRLYERAGFGPAAGFIFADRPGPVEIEGQASHGPA